mmetsp:Transcript_53008/g.60740  ORF Transcript_53008/g.60740 Transcript_53008/m.60740 type:complete len:833 (+) Transcript_53008:306-2804(+)
MVFFTVDQVRSVMDKQTNIRNISVIAHVDHGKTTLTDNLLAKGGLLNIENSRCGLDRGRIEIEKGITINSTAVTLLFEHQSASGDKESHLVNLIDSPGHVDFSSEVTAALRLTDGALVVVDLVEGQCVQTETVLRQAIFENVKPILMINKVDRGIFELKMSAEDIYQACARVIESINVTISVETPEDSKLPPRTVDPTNGSVMFGSGLQGWGFSIPQMARVYAKKFDLDEENLRKRLWGDNFFHIKKKKWLKRIPEDPQEAKFVKRGFNYFIMKPILDLTQAFLDEDTEKCDNLVKKLGIVLSKEEVGEKKGKQLLKVVLKNWLEVGTCLVDGIITHLPSPAEAQRYRCVNLYEGPQDDEAATAIRTCNRDGPVMVYVSKMVPIGDTGRYHALARVFSGVLETGTKVRIYGSRYVPGETQDLFVKKIQGVNVAMGSRMESVGRVPAGSVCFISGVDQFLVKSGTITTCETAHCIARMKHMVAPIVKVAISPKKPGDLPKLVTGLQRLQRADPLVECTKEDTGEHIIAASGELHMEVLLRDLQELYAKIELTTSNPVVTYKETVTEQSAKPAFTVSPNHHNRLYGVAEPLSAEFVAAVERGAFNPRDSGASKTLVKEWGWDKDEAKKIWTFGPEESGPNVFLETTKGVQYMNEVKDSAVAAFQWVSQGGALAEEELRGVKFSIIDATLHADSIHRGGGQIIPATRRCIMQAEITAVPRLVEPIFMVDVVCPPEQVGSVYSLLQSRRGMVVDETYISAQRTRVNAYLPVAESFGFSTAIRAATSGTAFAQCSFDHWETLNSDPLDPTTAAGKLVASIRERKGLNSKAPVLADFM